MSDFLNNFKKDNYGKKLADEEKDKDEQVKNKSMRNTQKISEPDPIPKEENLSQQQQIENANVRKRKTSNLIEPESRQKNRVAEITEKDPSYGKKQKQKYLLIALVTILLCTTAGGGFFILNRVTIPDFINKDVTEAKTWAIKNKIELDITEEYNTKAESQKVIEQGKQANKNIMKGSVLPLKVSKGADPEEQIKLPDFKTMKTAAIENWKKENAAENIKIIKEFHDTEENGKFLKMEFKDKTMTADNYRRKDGLTIYVSKGKEIFEKNIEVPNFKEKSKSEVETWAKTNDINMTYEEVGSNSIMMDMIVSQSITAGEKIAKKDAMTVQVSVGKTYLVPWFGNYTMNMAAMAEPGLQVHVVQKYDPDTKYGTLLWQSVGAGTYLTAKDDLNVKVCYSIGKPYIGDLTTMTEDKLAEYFYDFKEKGANITYSIHYVSGGEAGTISHASKNNEYVSMNEHVDVYVYR